MRPRRTRRGDYAAEDRRPFTNSGSPASYCYAITRLFWSSLCCRGIGLAVGHVGFFLGRGQHWPDPLRLGPAIRIELGCRVRTGDCRCCANQREARHTHYQVSPLHSRFSSRSLPQSYCRVERRQPEQVGRQASWFKHYVVTSHARSKPMARDAAVSIHSDRCGRSPSGRRRSRARRRSSPRGRARPTSRSSWDSRR